MTSATGRRWKKLRPKSPVTRVAEEDEETLERRPVEAHVVAQRRDLLRAWRCWPRQHDLDRVARRQRHHQEHDDADAEQHRDELQQALEEPGRVHRLQRVRAHVHDPTPGAG